MCCTDLQEILRKAIKVDFRIRIVAVRIPKCVLYQKRYSGNFMKSLKYLSRYSILGKRKVNLENKQ